MEKNLRTRMDDTLWSSETLIDQFIPLGCGRIIKSLFVHYEAIIIISFHYFRDYGGFICNW